MIYDTYTEKTVLRPTDHDFIVDGWLMESKYLQDSDPDDVYWFTFIPHNMSDYSRIQYKADEAQMALEINMGPYSNKKACKEIYHDGNILVSQLFKPKVTSELPTGDWSGMSVSLRVHFRDDPTGKIFLNCSFVDFYDPSNGTNEPVEEPDENYDFWA